MLKKSNGYSISIVTESNFNDKVADGKNRLKRRDEIIVL